MPKPTIPVRVLTSAVVVLASLPALSRPAHSKPYAGLDLFAKVLSYVEHEYVEDVPRSTLIRGAILGLLEALDPYSAYLTPQEVQKLRSGSVADHGRTGLEEGLARLEHDGPVIVVTPIEGSPAWKQGLKAGDTILEIQGSATSQLSLHEIESLLQGKPGTKVSLKVERPDWPEPRVIEVERAKVALPAVQMAMLAPRVAYFRLAFFRARADRELARKMKQAESEAGGSLDGVVFDLRSNPGGLVKTAVAVADLFLKRGLIVATKGRRRKEVRYYAHTRGTLGNWPMVTLIDSGTASAAEIVAGALKAHSRSLVLGTRSFGKGSVQELIGLPDGSALKLTTKVYYTPDHVSIQGKGIVPDVMIEQTRTPQGSGHDTIREKDLQGHFKAEPQKGGPAGADKFQPSPAARELLKDQQIRAALDYLRSWSLFKKGIGH